MPAKPPNTTTLVIFGSAEVGTPVMAASPLAALDLPLKVLVCADVDPAKFPTTDRPHWPPGTTSLPIRPGINTLTEALVAT